MKRNHGFAAMALLSILLLTGCANTAGNQTQQKSGAYHKITAEEAKERMDTGEAIIVDVRRADEYGQGHVPGAINIPNETIQQERPKQLPDVNAELLIYCRTGVRSKQASDKLAAMGYRNIYDFGGIVDWPYETEKEGKDK